MRGRGRGRVRARARARVRVREAGNSEEFEASSLLYSFGHLLAHLLS